jgi:hypothetical protein
MASKPVCVMWFERKGLKTIGDGQWCAVKPQPARLSPAVRISIGEKTSVPTVCGCVVILPCGVQRRAPTCLECKKALKR